MRLAYDLSVLRQPAAGTVRYATELHRAMLAARGDDEVDSANGWPRLPRSGGGIRRIANLMSDVGWLALGSVAFAVRHRSDVWFSPANSLPLFLPRPKVVAILDANVMQVGDLYDSSYVAYARSMLRVAAARADAILTLSEDARRTISESLRVDPQRIVVAYPGIDHAVVAAGDALPALPPAYALFVGQTEPHKNLERLVDAWSGDVPGDLGLVLAGPVGRDEERLTAQISSSPARDRIHRVGSVTPGQLARLYDDASCFVFPSLAEGFGLPPLEAMDRGIPTAVADASSLPEVTAGAALLFDPHRSEAIAAAVTSLLTDRALRARLALAGPTVASRYRWEATASIAWRTVRSVGHG